MELSLKTKEALGECSGPPHLSAVTLQVLGVAAKLLLGLGSWVKSRAVMMLSSVENGQADTPDLTPNPGR